MSGQWLRRWETDINESDYKRRLVKAVNQLPGGWARRVEDRYAVNVLDMIIKLPGHPMFFAEGKIVDGNLFAPTPGQYEEGKQLIRADVRVLLLGWKSGLMYISSWTKKADWREFCTPCPLGDVKGLLAYTTRWENPQ